MFLLVILSFLLTSTLSVQTKSEYDSPVHYANANQLSFINYSNSIHNPINITGDTELANISTSGNGSMTSPYIIGNFIINNCSTHEFGVSIQITDKYFVLSNITVSGCSNGFLLSNITYGRIINSNATSNTESGFVLDSSSNNVLVHNTAFGNGAGFGLSSNANNNTLIDNTAINNIYTGFYISDANNNTLIKKTTNNET